MKSKLVDAENKLLSAIRKINLEIVDHEREERKMRQRVKDWECKRAEEGKK